jgi:carboxyl-terminal processing protease
MKSRFLIFSFIFVLIATTLIGEVINRYTQASASNHTTGQARTTDIESSFSGAISVIENNYVDKIGHDDLTKASIQGMLRALDPHSNYFDSKEFEELQSEQHSQFYGIGVSINRRNNRVYVLSTIKGTPADQAGLRYGDAITKVDGKSATEWNTQKVLQHVRGPKGEAVEIEVERAGVPKPLTFKIVRDAVPLPSIRNAYMIRPGVGYIGLTGGFTHTTEDELTEALGKLKDQSMRSLVLDLRGNPGGLLTQAVKVANVFLQKGQTIVSIRGRASQVDAGESRTHQAINSSPEDIPLVVLINGNSASASEIVAGAIQDHDRGLILGENSFGKGLVQTVFRLPYGSGLTLTTAKYYTPSGRLIQRSYNGLSFYQYYTNHDKKKPPQGEAHRTDTGRDVYSGGGIKPDVEVKPTATNGVREKLFLSTFDFARQLTAGQIAGFPQFKTGRTIYNHKLRDDEFVINDKLIAAFRSFIASSDKFKVTDSQFTEQLNYLKRRIREEVVTAAYGSEIGTQVLMEGDDQVLRAIDELPNARALADSARSYKRR